MNVSSRFSEWRTACRMLWNETYRATILREGGSFELEANFCEVERLLFDALVLMELDGSVRNEADRLGSHMERPWRAVDRFRIVPCAPDAPVLINREIDSGYWDYPPGKLSPDDAVICFVHCFDFCGMDSPRRYEYYLGSILQCAPHPEITGRMILVSADLTEIEDTQVAES